MTEAGSDDLRRRRMTRHLLIAAAIEAPILFGGVALAMATGQMGWALAAAGLGMVVMLAAIAIAKRTESRSP